MGSSVSQKVMQGEFIQNKFSSPGIEEEEEEEQSWKWGEQDLRQLEKVHVKYKEG